MIRFVFLMKSFRQKDPIASVCHAPPVACQHAAAFVLHFEADQIQNTLGSSLVLVETNENMSLMKVRIFPQNRA